MTEMEIRQLGWQCPAASTTLERSVPHVGRRLALGLLLLLGCGGEGKPAGTGTDAAAGDDAGSDASSTAEPFGPCDAASSCPDGYTCINPVGRGGGTCTVTCSTNEDCGEAVCAQTDPRVCAGPCDGRPGYCPEGTCFGLAVTT